MVSKGYANNPRSPDGYYLVQVTGNGSYEFDSRCCAGGTPRVRSGTVGPNIADDTWHNVTVVRDYSAGANGQILSYIDGTLVHTIDMAVGDAGDWHGRERRSDGDR